MIIGWFQDVSRILNDLNIIWDLYLSAGSWCIHFSSPFQHPKESSVSRWAPGVDGLCHTLSEMNHSSTSDHCGPATGAAQLSLRSSNSQQLGVMLWCSGDAEELSDAIGVSLIWSDLVLQKVLSDLVNSAALCRQHRGGLTAIGRKNTSFCSAANSLVTREPLWILRAAVVQNYTLCFYIRNNVVQQGIIQYI